ncbi:MAG: LysE family translocator [Rhodospirillaceae bacterium]
MIPAPETLGLFFLAAVALALAPGPDNIFVLTQSALHGRRAGLFVTLGLCAGLLVHTAAVALGVAAVLAASPTAFLTLKLVGAGYLLYLAWMAFRAGATALDGEAPPLTSSALFRRGIVMNVTNPKVAIFFLAFLPQFADTALGPVGVQIIVFGALFIAATLLIFGGVAWGAGFLGDFLRASPCVQRIMNAVAGVVFVGLAVRLIATSR